MKRKIFMRAAAMAVAAVMATGYLPEISPIFETAESVYAADITQNTAIVINSSNKSTYNDKTITGTVPSSSYAGNQGAFISRGAIVVDGIELYLTIDGFNADYSDQYSPRSGISLVNGATLHLTVKGTNNLTGGFGGAGISVPDGCTLEITAESTGTLNATGGKNYGGGAGIGSNGNHLNTNTQAVNIYPQGLGNITINGGTINAQGGAWYIYYDETGGAAGIGSSELSGATSNKNYGANTYINNITGNITINGGTVTATGGYGAAGIGGGNSGTVKTINIKGGNITATAGQDGGAAIGLGANAFVTESDGTLTCPSIDISSGTVKANGNIGYGNVSGDSQNTGGSVAISDSAAVNCTGTINPTTASYGSRTFSFTIYDSSLTQTVKNAEIDLPLGRKATADITVDKAGIGTAAVTALYTSDQLSGSGTATVKFNNKSFTSESISLANANNTLVLGGYLYNFSGTIYDKNIALNTTADFTLDGVSNIFANAVYTPEIAGTGEKSGVAKFSGYFITPTELSGAKTFKVTDSNNKTYSREVTFPAASLHKSDLNFSITDGTVPAEVKYVDENNSEQTCSSFSMAANETSWGTAGNTNWIVVNNDMTVSDRITINGTVNLILCDGAVLTADKGITVLKGNTLNIYAQQDGTGSLYAYGNKVTSYKYNNFSGIGGYTYCQNGWTFTETGSISIYGGNITATGGKEAAGIGGGTSSDGGNITIYGGTINAAGGEKAAGIGSGSNDSVFLYNGGTIKILGGNITAVGGNGIYGGAGIGGGSKCDGGNITISGGTVNARGGGSNQNYGAGIGGGAADGNKIGAGAGTITITGGNITANSSGNGKGIGTGANANTGGTVSLSWTKTSDSIFANSYGAKSITLNKDFMIKDTDTAAATDNIANNTIVPKFTVSFDNNGGSGTMDSIGYASGREYTLPECTFTAPTGKTFDKWEINGKNYAAGESVVISGDTTIKAIYKMIPSTVTFNMKGHGEDLSQTVEYGAKATQPEAPTAEGYTFKGWYSDENCETPFDFDSPVTQDTTIYAKWTTDGYTISYDLDGSENAAANPTGYNVESEDITLAEPTKTGYSFTGWTYDGQTEPTKSVTIKKGSMGDKAYTANWQINQYTITFDTNGGSEVAAITQNYGTAITPPDAPTKDDCIFGGWEDLPETMPAGNKTIYAKWITLTKYEAKEPTCTETGNIEYYYGSDGNRYVKDENGYKKTTANEVTIPAKGHREGEISWTWDHYAANGELRAVITIKCADCDGNYVNPGVIDLDSMTTKVTKEPTADEDGELTYTASYEFNGVTYTNSDYTEPIPKTTAVAVIGTTSYSYLKDALDAAKEGDTVKLIADVNEPDAVCGGSPYYYEAFTLDLNGHTATVKYIDIMNNLTVKNGTLNADIINSSGGGNHTLKLDGVVLNTSTGEDSHGISWGAYGITLLSGSKITVENTGFSVGNNDGFELIIDATSSIIFKNARISVYDETSGALEEIEKYLPAGYSLKSNDDYGYHIADANGDKTTNDVELLAENFVLTKVEAKAATCEDDGCIEHYTDTHGNTYIERDGAYFKAPDVVIPALGHSWGEPAYKWSADYSTCTRTYVCQNDSTHTDPKTVYTVIENGIATATFDEEITRYSHTANVDDEGEANGQYGVYLDTNDTVKIDGAKKLSVKLKYGTESGFDYIYVYKDAECTKIMQIDDKDAKYSGNGEKTFEVDGDEVTFKFTSDSGVVDYGYYAVVTAAVSDVQIKEVKQIIPGDVNFDNKVDNEDAALVLKYISTGKAFYPNDEEQNERAILAANADGIGEVDMLDVIAILQKSKQA
ncbi:MAG TPA: hypothetical protein DCG28_01115 [Lachnospiraceae bacterium]|nr:hypothetical protein [Lachnospiraceae bacterium]